MLVVLIPTILVGTRYACNDMGASIMICCDGPMVTLDVEVVVELMGAFSS